jgi:segregation and condensation protein A
MAGPQDTPGGAPSAGEGFESQMDAIRVRLASFEGPLDLLLHLIRKHEVNIYDIPIALVTEQYLEYLAVMQELDLDLASEFLVMAATLIHIKSKMLLPRPQLTAEDLGEVDPRDELVRRLLEHQKFKAAAELLHERETVRNAQWTRPDARVEAIAGDEYEPELEVDLFGLLAAFRRVLERSKAAPVVPLPPAEVSIEARIEQLLERLSESEACGFEDLFDDVAGRGDLIVTFLALLEMIRLKLIRVFQQGQLGAIRIYKRARPQDAPHPIHDPEDEYRAHHHEASVTPLLDAAADHGAAADAAAADASPGDAAGDAGATASGAADDEAGDAPASDDEDRER